MDISSCPYCNKSFRTGLGEEAARVHIRFTCKVDSNPFLKKRVKLIKSVEDGKFHCPYDCGYKHGYTQISGVYKHLCSGCKKLGDKAVIEEIKKEIGLNESPVCVPGSVGALVLSVPVQQECKRDPMLLDAHHQEDVHNVYDEVQARVERCQKEIGQYEMGIKTLSDILQQGSSSTKDISASVKRSLEQFELLKVKREKELETCRITLDLLVAR